MCCDRVHVDRSHRHCAVTSPHYGAIQILNFYTMLTTIIIITGPPTHSVGGQTSNGRWHLSSVTLAT